MKRILAVGAAGLFSLAAHAEYKAIAELNLKAASGAIVHEGDHRVATEAEVCSLGTLKPGTWSTHINEQFDRGPQKLNSVQIIVPDARTAAKGATQFLLQVGFGPSGNRSARYDVDTRDPANKKGGGTVTIVDSGKTAKVSFSGITQNGVKIEGTVECKAVIRKAT